MPIPFFLCEKCKREHPTFEEAEACENSHLVVLTARAKQYTIGRYPFMLEVTFQDGATKDYIADDMH